MDTKEYNVLAEDGVTIETGFVANGGTVSLTDEQAAPLIETGSIELVEKEEEAE